MPIDQPPPEYMKPVPSGKRFGFLIAGVVFLGVAVLIVAKPDLLESLNPADVSRAKTRLLATVIKWVWSLPGAIILGLLGLLLCWMASKKLEDTRSLSEIVAERAKDAK